MSVSAQAAIIALNQRYFLDFPQEAARHLEELAPAQIGELLMRYPPHAAVRPWQRLTPDVARSDLIAGPKVAVRFEGPGCAGCPARL